MRKHRPLLCLFLLAPLFVGCFGNDVHINVNPDQLYGEWIQIGTQKHWTYNADGTGNKVDRSEFEDDDENNGDFE